VHEAGGNLVTNLPAAVARAEQGACAATAAAVDAAAAAGGAYPHSRRIGRRCTCWRMGGMRLRLLSCR
jgi:hypothetical protein